LNAVDGPIYAIAEVVKADREQISRWWATLPSPQNEHEGRIYELIFKKYRCLGGSATDEYR